MSVIAIHLLDNTEIAELLIKKGANVNADNINGRTPLNRAAKRGKLIDLELSRSLILSVIGVKLITLSLLNLLDLFSLATE